ncbi:MAG: hypothetical protein K8U03_24110 [Planctomycetia bacterium]|nr:hypothetical protein [Planctomycetia bacterium]
MLPFLLMVAVLNLTIGFLVAVYTGAAPRYYNPRFPVLREGRRAPTGLIARIVGMLRPGKSV